MATYEAKLFSRPAITPAGNWPVNIVGVLDIADLPTTLAQDDIIKFGKVGQHMSAHDLSVDSSAAIATLAGDVGILNAAGDDTGAEFFTAQSFASAGVVRASKAGSSNVTNAADTEAVIALKVTTASAATTGVIVLRAIGGVMRGDIA